MVIILILINDLNLNLIVFYAELLVWWADFRRFFLLMDDVIP